jgi:hypothetical protein
MAQTLRGVVQNSVASQQQQAQMNETRLESLEENLFQIKGMLGMIAAGPARKRARITGEFMRAAVPFISHIFMLASTKSLTPPTSVPTWVPPASIHEPPQALPPPVLPPKSNPQLTALPPPILPLQPATTVPNVSFNPSHVAAVVSPAAAPLSSEERQRHTCGSGGNISPLPPNIPNRTIGSACAFTSKADVDGTRKSVKWAALAEQYSQARLLKHQWEWTGSDWVPYYEFRSVSTFRELWEEYSTGRDGFLPVRILTERWATKPAWHRNVAGKKTEAGRRKKVTHLIEELAKRPRWDVSRALKFLEDTYGVKYTAGKFARWLCEGKNGKGANLKIVSDDADKYKG